MTRITIPGTDLSVSPLCVGSGEFGTTVNDEQVARLLDQMVDLGGNFLDTASIYGDWVPEAPRHASEKAIGKWLRSRPSAQVVVGTKGGHPSIEAPSVGRLTQAPLFQDIEDSRAALGLDSLDLYTLHTDDPELPVSEIMDSLFEARARGWVRYLGASNWQVPRLLEAQAYADAQGQAGFVVDQTLWNAAVLQVRPYGSDRTAWMNSARFQLIRDRGMHACPYQAQAFGLFQRMHAGTLDSMNPGFRGFYEPEEAKRRYTAMREILSARDLSITQVVLGYLLSQPISVTPIVGIKTPEQLADCFRATDVRLSDAEVFAIDQGNKGSELP